MFEPFRRLSKLKASNMTQPIFLPNPLRQYPKVGLDTQLIAELWWPQLMRYRKVASDSSWPVFAEIGTVRSPEWMPHRGVSHCRPENPFHFLQQSKDSP